MSTALPARTEFHPGDFNGDGIYDLLAYDPMAFAGGEARMIQIGPTANVTMEMLVGRGWPRNAALTVADLTGDGRADLFLYDDLGTSAQSFSATFDMRGRLASYQRISTQERPGSTMFPGQVWEGAGVDLLQVELNQSGTELNANMARLGGTAGYIKPLGAPFLMDPHFGINGFFDF